MIHFFQINLIYSKIQNLLTHTTIIMRENRHQIMSKNSYLFSYNGFQLDKSIANSVKQIRMIIQELEKNKVNPKYQIKSNVIRLCQKHQNLFRSWYLTQQDFHRSISFYDQQVKYFQLQLERLENLQDKNRQQQMRQNYQQIEFYKRQQNAVKQNVKNSWKSQIQKIKIKNNTQKKLQQGQDKENEGLLIQSFDRIQQNPISMNEIDLEIVPKEESDPPIKNPYFRDLLRHESLNYKSYVYLPSLLKITIHQINSLDRTNQIADISLKLELKVRLSTLASYQSMSRLKMKIHSTGLGQYDQNTVRFQYLNSSESNISYWDNPRKYFQVTGNSQGIPWNQATRIIDSISYFEGFVYSAKLNNVKVKIKTYDFHSPFQILDLHGFVKVQQIETTLNQWGHNLAQFFENFLAIKSNIVMKFNLISLDQSFESLSHQINTLPNVELDDYDLAENLIKFEISNKKESDYELKKTVCGWQWKKSSHQQTNDLTKQFLYVAQNYAHFHFPIYRNPNKPLLIIFLPTIVLGIINLFIFFQDIDLADRIANIATLLISFVAMITIVQSEIKRSVVSVTMILVIMMVLTPLFCLSETMYLYFNGIQEPEPLKSVLFWICVAITVLNCAYPLIMFVFFQCCHKNKLNIKQIVQKQILVPGDDKLSQYQQNDIQINDKMIRIKAVSASQNSSAIEIHLKNFTQQRIIRHIVKSQQALEECQRLLPKILSHMKNSQMKKTFLNTIYSKDYQNKDKVLDIGGTRV